VLLRLAYLGVTNVFALLRLLPRSDHDKDTETVILRHQFAVLQRQLGDQQPCAPRIPPASRRSPYPATASAALNAPTYQPGEP
jgi:hypothetical protein